MPRQRKKSPDRIRRHTDGQIIHQRMKIHPLGSHKAAVQCQLHPMFAVIDQREQADRAGANPCLLYTSDAADE